MSDAQVTSYTVRSLLGDASRYLIPMYQRNYAWGEGESHSTCAGHTRLPAKKPA